MKRKILATILIAILGISIFITSNAGVSTTDLNIKDSYTAEEKISSIILPIYITDTSGNIESTLGYSATLEYDENIFESVTFTTQNSWSGTYNDTTKKILQDTASATQNQKIGEFTFNLKQYSSNISTAIKFKNIVLTDGENTNNLSDKTINITLNIPQNNTTSNNTTTNTNNNTNTNSNIQNTNTNSNISSVAGNTTKDATTAKNILPAAGIQGFIIVAIIITIIAIVFFKFKSRKIK